MTNTTGTRTAGITILTCVGVAMLAANAFFYVMPTWWGPDDYEAVLVYMAAGILTSEAAIIGAWAVMSADSLRRRTVFLASAVCALICSVWFGYLIAMPADESLAFVNPEFAMIVAGFAPGFLVSAMTPFVLIRWFRRVISVDEVRQSGGVTIAAIMIFTGIVALGIAGVELATYATGPQMPGGKWGTAVAVFGTAFGISLLGAVPMMFLLMSGKLSPRVIVALLLSVSAGVVGCAVFEGIDSRGTRFLPARWTSPGVAWLFIPAVCGLMITAFFTGLRLLGFRLQKSFAAMNSGKPSAAEKPDA